MTVRIAEGTLFYAPADAVFRLISGAAVPEGEVRRKYALEPTVKARVTSLEPGRRLVLHEVRRLGPGIDWQWDVESEGGATIVHLTCEASSEPGPLRGLLPPWRRCRAAALEHRAHRSIGRLRATVRT